MSFKQLYEICQGQGIPVELDFIKQQTLKLTNTPSIDHYKVDLEETALRGFFIKAKKPLNSLGESHNIIKQPDGSMQIKKVEGKTTPPTIVTSKTLNKCWERFIFTKELMHLFDKKNERTSSDDDFDLLLSDLTTRSASNPQSKSEVKSFWMALAILCPKKKIDQFKSELSSKTIGNYEVASLLRLPEEYTPHLFTSQFSKRVEKLISSSTR